MAVYTTTQEVKAKTSAKGTLFGDEPQIVLRDEQRKAVKDALKRFKQKSGNKFLWNAKMRFGKTLCALQLAREMGQLEGEQQVRRTLIVTHRPVVNKGWKEDFDKIFFDLKDNYHYGTKFEDSEEGNFYDLERRVEERGESYVFFASMQYLRRSCLVNLDGEGDDDQLKKDILQNHWDLVVVDEAHEGTRTALGKRVIELLAQATPHTKVLHLSGTPFNLYDDFTDDEIFTWDYVKEQQAKRDWPLKKENSNLPPEENPYRDLPTMEIRTYDLGKLVNLGDGAIFSFKDFFQTWTGNPKSDGKPMPEGQKGRFVREQAVRDFLDLLCTDDEESHYPFSNDDYRQQFNHTLWVVPGVKEAKALEQLLKEHELFGEYFKIINVAGSNDDDETRADALDKVLHAIGPMPQLTQTITLSCGRLTTGVTVKPWSAVFYLKGSENTSAATYMQTIFRVQSPYTYMEDGRMMMKQKCYVFDFAPDRTLKMVAETAKFRSLTQKEKSNARATSHEQDIENMEDFLQFCPVISMQGGRMVEYNPNQLFEQLEHVYIDRVVRNGFNDNSLYDMHELMALTDDEISQLNTLGDEIAKTTNMEKPKWATTISHNGLSPRQQAAAARAEKKNRNHEPLTDEERAALEAAKKRREEERRERDNRITILRGISLRIPLLMFGAEIEDEETGLTLDNFTNQVDPASWEEFMPRGVKMSDFNRLRKCYNATVFAAAGKRYRELAREADLMHTDERVQRIAEIFSYFHNPDKETVLTPWRVVNMHISDCLGGYCFFNERFDGPNQKAISGADGELFDWIDTAEPRFVDRGEVTQQVFGNTHSRILEINSKTGLYPLYVAYSLYRSRMNDFVEAGLISDPENYSVEEEQVIWDDILRSNIYVICNTRMAASITRRTLRGFRQLGDDQLNIKQTKLITRAQTDREALVADIRRPSFWHSGAKDKNMIKFTAVVGNPPYQVMDGGAGVSAVPVYNIFVDAAIKLSPNLISMIMPARWYAGGKGLDQFRDMMLSCNHISALFDYFDATEVFPKIDLSGGVCYFLYDKEYSGNCNVCTSKNGIQTSLCRPLNTFDGNFIRFNEAVGIVNKIKTQHNIAEENMSCLVSSRKPFGITTNEKISGKQCASSYFIYAYPQNGYVAKEQITNNENWIQLYKVFISYAYGERGDFPYFAIGKPFMGEPGTCCSETYLVISPSCDKEIVKRVMQYLKTKFLRFMILLRKNTQHATSKVYTLVPLQDFTPNSDIDWSQSVSDIDQQLYKKYGLTEEEVSFIERMIKPME